MYEFLHSQGLKLTGRWGPPDIGRPICFMRIDDKHHDVVLFELPEDARRAGVAVTDSSPSGMRTRASSKRKAEKLRSRRVSILRARAQYLGNVQAPDEKAAEARAIEEFKIGADQRRRLVVRGD
jgi:hypothetical protein